MAIRNAQEKRIPTAAAQPRNDTVENEKRTPFGVRFVLENYCLPMRIWARAELSSRMMVLSLPVRLFFSASSARVNS